MKCNECGKETDNILVDQKDKPHLEFCSWDCLMKYAIKAFCEERSTTGVDYMEGGNTSKQRFFLRLS